MKVDQRCKRNNLPHTTDRNTKSKENYKTTPTRQKQKTNQPTYNQNPQKYQLPNPYSEGNERSQKTKNKLRPKARPRIWPSPTRKSTLLGFTLGKLSINRVARRRKHQLNLAT